MKFLLEDGFQSCLVETSYVSESFAKSYVSYIISYIKGVNNLILFSDKDSDVNITFFDMLNYLLRKMILKQLKL